MLKVMKSGLLAPGEGEQWRGNDLHAVAAWREGQLWESVLQSKAAMFGWAIAAAVLGVVVCGFLLMLEEDGMGIAAGVAVAVGIAAAAILFFSAKRAQPASRVSTVSKVYWPGLILPLEDKAAVYDLAGIFPKREVSLQLLNHPDQLVRVMERIEELMGELQVLEPEDIKLTVNNVPLYGVDAQLVRALHKLNGVLDDVRRIQVQVPAIGVDAPFMTTLSRLSPQFLPGNPSPVVASKKTEDIMRMNGKIEGVYRESQSDVSYDIDDTLAELESLADVLMDGLEQAHHESVAMLNASHCLATGTVSWPTIVHHCPACTTLESIGEDGSLPASTRLVFDAETRLLRCPVCENFLLDSDAVRGSRFNFEVFKPAYLHIVLDLRKEILRIDREIDRQMMELSDKRAIELKKLGTTFKQELRKKIERLRAHKNRADALKAQILGVTAAMVKYERIASGMISKFRENCTAIAQEVEKKALQAEKNIQANFEKESTAALAQAREAYAIERQEEQVKHAEVLAAQDKTRQAVVEGAQGTQQAIHSTAAKTQQILMMTEAEKMKFRDQGLFREITGLAGMERSGISGKSAKARERA